MKFEPKWHLPLNQLRFHQAEKEGEEGEREGGRVERGSEGWRERVRERERVIAGGESELKSE